MEEVATQGGGLTRASDLIAMPAKHHYVADASLSEKGLGYHLERTVFCDVNWQACMATGDVERLLGQAARVAASKYVERIGKMTLGLIGPAKSARHANTIYLAPFGVKLLKIMGFSEFDSLPEEEACGEVSCGVESGFLAARYAEPEVRGRLIMRWFWDVVTEQEVFETEVRDYVPRLMGKRGRWWGRLFYRLTQVNFHKLVMWGYHWWVRKNRRELLLCAARELEGKKLLT